MATPVAAHLSLRAHDMDKLHRILLLVVVVSCVVGWAAGQDYEDDRAPPVRARPPRGPIVPSRANKQAVQKTSTTEAPPLEPELEEYEDELIEEEPTTTTTTEAPRKGLRGGVVRPFRSNTDLIEALKRRRAQAQGNGGSSYQSSGSSSTTTSTTTESSSRQGRKSKGKFSRGGGSVTSTTEQPLEEQPAPRSRAFARGRRF